MYEQEIKNYVWLERKAGDNSKAQDKFYNFRKHIFSNMRIPQSEFLRLVRCYKFENKLPIWNGNDSECGISGVFKVKKV